MTNNQNSNPNEDPNQIPYEVSSELTDDELASVSGGGGGLIDSLVDAGKQVLDAGKEFVEEVGDALF